jgi:hypothetical protein
MATGLTLLRAHFKAHDEALAILFRYLMNGANVGMVQRGSCLGFTSKTAQDLRMFGHFGGQDLQRHKAIEFSVLGFVNNAHPAAPQLLDDAVVAQLKTDA